MHIKSTFIDYYYCYIADAMEIHPANNRKGREQASKRDWEKEMWSFAMLVLFHCLMKIHGKKISFEFCKCQKLFMKLSFNE